MFPFVTCHKLERDCVFRSQTPWFKYVHTEAAMSLYVHEQKIAFLSNYEAQL